MEYFFDGLAASTVAAEPMEIAASDAANPAIYAAERQTSIG